MKKEHTKGMLVFNFLNTANLGARGFKRHPSQGDEPLHPASPPKTGQLGYRDIIQNRPTGPIGQIRATGTLVLGNRTKPGSLMSPMPPRSPTPPYPAMWWCEGQKAAGSGQFWKQPVAGFPTNQSACRLFVSGPRERRTRQHCNERDTNDKLRKET